MTRQSLALIRPSLNPHPLRAGLGASAPAGTDGEGPGNELRLFLTAWLGGLVFFGTFLA